MCLLPVLKEKRAHLSKVEGKSEEDLWNVCPLALFILQMLFSRVFCKTTD